MFYQVQTSHGPSASRNGLTPRKYYLIAVPFWNEDEDGDDDEADEDGNNHEEENDEYGMKMSDHDDEYDDGEAWTGNLRYVYVLRGEQEDEEEAAANPLPVATAVPVGGGGDGGDHSAGRFRELDSASS